MKYFDLHCDTITELYKCGQGICQNTLAVDLQKAASLEGWIQVFAVFMPDDLRGEQAYTYFCKCRQYLQEQIAQNQQRMVFINTREDLNLAQSTGRCGAVLSVEGGSVLQGDAQNVQKLKDLGVKLITITWNGANELACGIGEENDTGLTMRGRACIKAMQEAGIVMDVSHLSRRSFDELLDITSAPLVASHSNLHALCRHRRNLTNQQFLAIAGRGGLVGVNFYKAFLNDHPEKAGIEDMVRHIEGMLALGGEKTVAIGSDFDGADMPADLTDIRCVERLYNRLLQKNFSSQLVENLFYNNAYRFFKTIL